MRGFGLSSLIQSVSAYAVSILSACFVLALSAYFSKADAAVIAVEQFNYASTKLDGRTLADDPAADGGQGWDGAWTGLDYFRTAGLTHPGVTSAGGHVESRSFETTTAFRIFDTGSLGSSLVSGGKFGVDGSTIWFRFLMERNPADTAGSGGFAGLSLFDASIAPSSGERLFIGKRSNQSVWGLQTYGTGETTTNTTVSINNPVMFIARIDFSGADDQVRLWALTGAPPEEDVDLGAPAITVTGLDFQFDRIRIGTGNDNVYNFDEIFFATTFNDLFPTAIPEATTGVLFVLGLFMLRYGRQFAQKRRGMRSLNT